MGFCIGMKIPVWSERSSRSAQKSSTKTVTNKYCRFFPRCWVITEFRPVFFEWIRLIFTSLLYKIRIFFLQIFFLNVLCPKFENTATWAIGNVDKNVFTPVRPSRNNNIIHFASRSNRSSSYFVLISIPLDEEMGRLNRNKSHFLYENCSKIYIFSNFCHSIKNFIRLQKSKRQ